MSTKIKNARLAVYCMVKAPQHELEWFAHYHLSIGAELILLYFDDPADPAIDGIKHPSIRCFRCDDVEQTNEPRTDPGYWPKKITANIRHAMSQSLEQGIGWLAIIDQDELIHCPSGLLRQIQKASIKADILSLEVCEALSPEKSYDNFFTEINHFKRQPLPPRFAKNGSYEIIFQWAWFCFAMLVARMLRITNAGLRSYLNGHRVGKTIIRTDLVFQMATAHGPVLSQTPEFKALRLKRASMLHFEACGYENWKMKFEHMIKVVEYHQRLSQNRRNYVRKFERAKNGGEEALWSFYKESKSFSKHKLILLRLLGLVRKINLDQKLFASK